MKISSWWTQSVNYRNSYRSLYVSGKSIWIFNISKDEMSSSSLLIALDFSWKYKFSHIFNHISSTAHFFHWACQNLRWERVDEKKSDVLQEKWNWRVEKKASLLNGTQELKRFPPYFWVHGEKNKMYGRFLSHSVKCTWVPVLMLPIKIKVIFLHYCSAVE